jgi:hypothetical protein
VEPIPALDAVVAANPERQNNGCLIHGNFQATCACPGCGSPVPADVTMCSTCASGSCSH